MQWKAKTETGIKHPDERSGCQSNKIEPKLSQNGCLVVAITSSQSMPGFSRLLLYYLIARRCRRGKPRRTVWSLKFSFFRCVVFCCCSCASQRTGPILLYFHLFLWSFSNMCLWVSPRACAPGATESRGLWGCSFKWISGVDLLSGSLGLPF